jgi:hypothetical protein
MEDVEREAEGEEEENVDIPVIQLQRTYTR